MSSYTKPTITPPEDFPGSKSEPMSTYVPIEVGDCVREDGKSDDRSESYIIARILKKHYAKRLAARARTARRAA